MAENEDGGGTDEPEEGAEGGRDPEHRNADHEEAGVEGFLSDNVFANLYWVGRFVRAAYMMIGVLQRRIRSGLSAAR